MTDSSNKRWTALLRNVVLIVCGTALGIFVALELQVWLFARQVAAVGNGPNVNPGQRLKPGEVPSPDNFDPSNVIPPQPLVEGFNILAGEKADAEMEDDELVLALILDGHARAYPINVLNGPTREIINDELAGRPIAATW